MKHLFVFVCISIVGGFSFSQEKEPFLSWPADNENSYRVLQDFRWSIDTTPGTITYNLDIYQYFDGAYHLYYSSPRHMPQNGKLLGDDRSFSVCVFNPIFFMDDYTNNTPYSSERNQGSKTLSNAFAPILDPGYKYKWEVEKYLNGQLMATDYRYINILYDPNFKLGLNTHFCTPFSWYPEIDQVSVFSNPTLNSDNISAMVMDIDDLNLPFLFEGMLMAWGRDSSLSPYVESDIFINYYNQMDNRPLIIGNYLFQPYGVRDSAGQPILPVLGIDFFTMFDIWLNGQNVDGTDASYISNTDYQIEQTVLFSKNDPRLRPPFLFDIKDLNSVPIVQNYQNLNYYHDEIMCYYFNWRKEPNESNASLLEDFITYYRNIPFEYHLKTNIATPFLNYVRQTVERYPANIVPIWHFLNEPNGPWQVDPRLYAHLISKFHEAVKAGDPNAKVMTASLIFWDGFWHSRGATPVLDLEINPAIVWLESFSEELKRMLANGEIDTLPFEYTGLDFYIPVDDNFWNVDYSNDPTAPCPTQNDMLDLPCGQEQIQDCILNTYISLYINVKDILQDLEQHFNATEKTGIIIKEYSLQQGFDILHPDHDFNYSLETQNLGKTVAFFHELGDVVSRGYPTSSSTSSGSCGSNMLASTPDGLRSDPAINRIKGVLFHHYYWTSRAPLIENTENNSPTVISHTNLWDAVQEINSWDCLEPLVTLEDNYSISCGTTISIHPRESYNPSYNYKWYGNGTLLSESYTLNTEPHFSTLYKLDVEYMCNTVSLVNSDQITVFVNYQVYSVELPANILNQGEIYHINWESACASGAPFDIDLYHNNVKYSDIGNTTNFYYDWTIGPSVLPGNDYQIKITSSSGDSSLSTPFEIRDSSSLILNEDFSLKKAIVGFDYSFLITGLASSSYPLVFSKIAGPSWVNISQDGEVSGIPSPSATGLTILDIQVSDGFHTVSTSLPLLTKGGPDKVGISDFDNRILYLGFDINTGLPETILPVHFAWNRINYPRPIFGDWDNDGLQEIGISGVKRGEDQHWFSLFSTAYVNKSGYILSGTISGLESYMVRQYIFGDWDGDGIDTPGIIFKDDNYLGEINGLGIRNTNSSGDSERIFYISNLPTGSNSTHYPVSGDFNGNGKDSFGIVVVKSLEATFFLHSTLPLGVNSKPADIVFTVFLPPNKDTGQQYMTIPVMGDWNGDGIDTPSLFDSSGNILFFWNDNVNSDVPSESYQILSGIETGECYPVMGYWDLPEY